MTQPTLEFWFDYASTYSYLSVQRIEALAAARGVAVRWRPFLLGPIFQQRGFTNSPFVLDPVRGDYMWRDMARRAARFGLLFRRPSAFPRASTLPLRVAALAAAQGAAWLPEFSRRVTRQNFADDLDIGDTAQVLRALDGLVPDPAATLAEAAHADNKALLRANTEAAQQRGIFGAPTFIVGDELFWGDDRLEDALDAAAMQASHARPPIPTDASGRPVALRAIDAPLRARPSVYPEPFASRMAGREKRPLGDLFGLANFGVNLTRIHPGGSSALRHAHSRQDEFIYILEGHPTLHTDAGLTPLAPGFCAGFKAGTGDGHRLINQTASDVLYLEIGDRSPDDTGSYPDDDLAATRVNNAWVFTRKDGTPY